MISSIWWLALELQSCTPKLKASHFPHLSSFHRVTCAFVEAKLVANPVDGSEVISDQSFAHCHCSVEGRQGWAGGTAACHGCHATINDHTQSQSVYKRFVNIQVSCEGGWQSLGFHLHKKSRHAKRSCCACKSAQTFLFTLTRGDVDIIKWLTVRITGQR